MDLLFHAFMWDKTHHLDSVSKDTGGSDINIVHVGLSLHSFLWDKTHHLVSVRKKTRDNDIKIVHYMSVVALVLVGPKSSPRQCFERHERQGHQHSAYRSVTCTRCCGTNLIASKVSSGSRLQVKIVKRGLQRLARASTKISSVFLATVNQSRAAMERPPAWVSTKKATQQGNTRPKTTCPRTEVFSMVEKAGTIIGMMAPKVGLPKRSHPREHTPRQEVWEGAVPGNDVLSDPSKVIVWGSSCRNSERPALRKTRTISVRRTPLSQAMHARWAKAAASIWKMLSVICLVGTHSCEEWIQDTECMSEPVAQRRREDLAGRNCMSLMVAMRLGIE